MDDQYMIEIDGLTKSFKSFEVLKGIDLKVRKGSVFSLLGSNGSGKTTTIKILSTLLKPDSGQVKLAGIDVVKDPKSIKKHIALTGQYAAVDEILTGRENLIMMARLQRVPDYKGKVNDLLEQFDMQEAADRRVSTYSGGMKRKIDIAMSLIGNPGIIFLDEPTTGLDPQSRKVMWKMIRGLTEMGVTIFLTTQYLDEAEALADQIAILNKGYIIASGTNEELKEIISSDIIKLFFKTEEETYRARLLLSDYEPELNVTCNELSIEVHHPTQQLMTILNRLTTSGIEVDDFEKRKASLEDVFLEVIGYEGREIDAISG